MRYLKVTIAILILGILSCKPNKSIEIDYCEMVTRDQSNVDDGETEKAVIEENHKRRKQLILEN